MVPSDGPMILRNDSKPTIFERHVTTEAIFGFRFCQNAPRPEANGGQVQGLRLVGPIWPPTNYSCRDHGVRRREFKPSWEQADLGTSVRTSDPIVCLLRRGYRVDVMFLPKCVRAPRGDGGRVQGLPLAGPTRPPTNCPAWFGAPLELPPTVGGNGTATAPRMHWRCRRSAVVPHCGLGPLFCHAQQTLY
jgi:hypothetical protein